MSVEKNNRLQVFLRDSLFSESVHLVVFVLLLGGACPFWGSAFGAQDNDCFKNYRALNTRGFHYKVHYETAEKFPELVAAVDAAKAAFYKGREVSEAALLSATEKLWLAAGLKYKREPVPASPNLGIPAHESLRLSTESDERGPGLHKYVKDVKRIYDHLTRYDPFVLRWTNSVGLRQSRDVWEDGKVLRYEQEVLISDSVARDLSIKDTLTHEAIHMQSGVFRRQGIDSDLHGYLNADKGTFLSGTNASPLYPSNMWLEELATAAHDAYRASLAIKYELENLQIESNATQDSGAKAEILARSHALLNEPRFNWLFLRARDLGVIATQTQEVSHRLALAYRPEYAGFVSVTGERADALNWVRVKAEGVSYVVPLLGPELSLLPLSGEGALPILERRLVRINTLATSVRQSASSAAEGSKALRQNGFSESLEGMKQNFDVIMKALEHSRVETLRAMPRRPRHPPKPAALAS